MVQQLHGFFCTNPSTCHHAHQSNWDSGMDTIKTLGLGALGFLAAGTLYGTNPLLAAGLQLLVGGAGLVWLFKRIFSCSSNPIHSAGHRPQPHGFWQRYSPSFQSVWDGMMQPWHFSSHRHRHASRRRHSDSDDVDAAPLRTPHTHRPAGNLFPDYSPVHHGAGSFPDTVPAVPNYRNGYSSDVEPAPLRTRRHAHRPASNLFPDFTQIHSGAGSFPDTVPVAPDHSRSRSSDSIRHAPSRSFGPTSSGTRGGPSPTVGQTDDGRPIFRAGSRRNNP